MKLRPVGAELFHADGHTAVTKLKDALRSSANASKTCHNSVLENCDVISLSYAEDLRSL
jgi:hypothetical protein